MTEKDFQKGFAIFMATFDKNYPPATLKIYYGLLQDLNPESFLIAIQAICQGQKEWYPNTNVVAMIRDRVADLENDLPSPEEAWELVLSGAWGGLQPEIQRAIKAVGLEYHTIEPGGGFCLAPEEIAFIRKDFLKFYASYSKQEHDEKVVPITSRLEAKGILKQVGMKGKEAGN